MSNDEREIKNVMKFAVGFAIFGLVNVSLWLREKWYGGKNDGTCSTSVR